MQTFEKALVEERATVGVEQRQRVGKRRTASLEAMMLNAGVGEEEVVVGVVVGGFEVVGTTLMVMRLEMKRVAKQETRSSGKITARKVPAMPNAADVTETIQSEPTNMEAH